MAYISADCYTTAASQILASRQDSAYDFRPEEQNLRDIRTYYIYNIILYISGWWFGT